MSRYGRFHILSIFILIKQGVLTPLAIVSEPNDKAEQKEKVKSVFMNTGMRLMKVPTVPAQLEKPAVPSFV